MKHPIFILGCPRSGTTLLANLLKNSNYGEPVETHFITKYYKKLDSYGNIENKRNFTRLLHDILAERPVMQWKIEIDIDKFYNELEEFSYRQIVDKICMARSKKKGYKSWGDKTPGYILDLDIVYQLFPESKYIYIVRDGRDVALSLLDREWGPNNILACAEYWKRCNDYNVIIDKLKNQKQLYFVQYEELLNNAKHIVPDIYKFLGEQYDENKMDNLINKIKKDNYNKWKGIMNERQIRLFESVASNTLKRFGYETGYEETGINGFITSFFKFHDAFMKAKFLFKLNVIDTIKIRFFGKQPFGE